MNRKQGIVYGAEYQLLCVGNSVGHLGILQFAPGESRECSYKRRRNTIYNTVYGKLLNKYEAERDSFMDE